MSTIPSPPVGLPASPPARSYPPPSQFFAILAVIIFLAEMVSMMVLYFLKMPDYVASALLDGIIMVALILPGLYYLQQKPLLNQIEERDRVEKALRASESLTRKVLDTLPVGVWILDQKGNIIHGNPACYEIWGGAKFVGIEQYQEYKAWWPGTGKRIESQEWAAARAITQGEVILDEEVEIESFEGKRKFILNSALPIIDEQDEIQGAIVVNHDVTEKKLAQQEIIHTNELLEKLFSNISTSIAYLDRDFNFIRVNDTYARSAGYSPEYFVGKNHFEMYPHDENQEIFQNVVKTGKPYSVLEKPFTYPDFPERGVTYWNWSLQPVKSTDNKVEGVVLSLLDVTERKRAEIQVARQNEELLELTRAEHKQRLLAEGLVQATIAVNSSLQLRQVLCSILEQIRKEVPFQGADIVLVQENNLRVASFLGFEDHPLGVPYLDETKRLDDFPLLEQVYSTRRPSVINLIESDLGWRMRPDMEWVHSYAAVPLIIADQVAGIINLFSEEEAAFNEEAVNQLLSYAAPAAVALNNAQLYRAETRARQLAETLSAAAQELTQTLDLDHVFETLLDHIHRVIPSDTAAVTLLTSETHLVVRTLRGYGRWADQVEIPTVPHTSHTDGLILRLNSLHRSLVIPNIPTLQPGDDRSIVTQIQSWLVVPIIASEKVIGMVEFGNQDRDPYTPEEIEWVEALVSQAAVAIQNAWLFEQVRSSSDRLQSMARKLVEIQESERTSIARELHDEAGQALSSIKLSLGKIESDPACPPHLRTRLLDLKAQADTILEDLHRLAMYLRPVALDRLGLVAAVEQLAHNIDSAWLTIRFKAVGFTIERLPRDLESALYRIVQEAVTNILRHAHASTVGILLEKDQERVRVFVEDDGVGFESDLLTKQDRLGMVGMRERAEMFGGSLTVESTPGKGTSIIVEVPVGYPDSDR